MTVLAVAWSADSGLSLSPVIPILIVFSLLFPLWWLRARNRESSNLYDDQWTQSFTVTIQRWRIWLILACSVALLALGVVALLGGTAWSNQTVEAVPFIFGLLSIAGGMVLLVVDAGYALFKLTVTSQQITVCPGLGPTRQILPGDIAELRRLSGNYGGFKAYDQAGKRLFQVDRVSVGYDHLFTWLCLKCTGLDVPDSAIPDVSWAELARRFQAMATRDGQDARDE